MKRWAIVVLAVVSALFWSTDPSPAWSGSRGGFHGGFRGHHDGFRHHHVFVGARVFIGPGIFFGPPVSVSRVLAGTCGRRGSADLCAASPPAVLVLLPEPAGVLPVRPAMSERLAAGRAVPGASDSRTRVLAS